MGWWVGGWLVEVFVDTKAISAQLCWRLTGWLWLSLAIMELCANRAEKLYSAHRGDTKLFGWGEKALIGWDYPMMASPDQNK